MDYKQSCPNFALEGHIILLYLTVNKLVLCTRRGYNLYLLRLFNFTNILEKLDWDKSYQCLCSQDSEKHARPMENFLPASFPTFFGNFLFWYNFKLKLQARIVQGKPLYHCLLITCCHICFINLCVCMSAHVHFLSNLTISWKHLATGWRFVPMLVMLNLILRLDNVCPILLL